MSNEYITKWERLILGIFLFVYGLNQFVHFIPLESESNTSEARIFLDAVRVYLPYLYVFEMLIGVLLVLDRWTSFVLVVLFPLSISFLIFNFTNQNMTNSVPALIVSSLNIYLMISRKEIYAPLFD